MQQGTIEAPRQHLTQIRVTHRCRKMFSLLQILFFFFVISAILVRSGKFFPNPERNKSNEIIHADLESGRGGRLFRFHVLAPESPEDAKQRSPTDVVPEMLFAAR